MTCVNLSTNLLRDLYAKMLLTRIIDERAQDLCDQRMIEPLASCRGYEAIQVGSALCIEVGQDFTLPYYRDLGVVLTIGMTPYEVFRSYLQTHSQAGQTHKDHPMDQAEQGDRQEIATAQSFQHWGYHKHNTVTGPVPVATQLLHGVGIAFACKLRKASAVTVAYCGDEVTNEADFTEALHFAAQHQLPIVFICEHASSLHPPATPTPTTHYPPSCLQNMVLPVELRHHCIDGTDVAAVYTATHQAMDRARSNEGPTLLEMVTVTGTSSATMHDPLIRCQYYLQSKDAWDDEWANQLTARLTTEIEHAFQDALRDINNTPTLRHKHE